MAQIHNETAYENAIKARIWHNANKTFHKMYGENAMNVVAFLTAEVYKAKPYDLWQSFYDGYMKYGKLSEKQVNCVLNSIAKREAKKEEFDKTLQEERSKSNFVGEVGAKETLALQVEKIISYDRRQFHYYDRGYSILFLMKDGFGNRVVYNCASGYPRFKDTGEDVKEGDMVAVTAFIKEHKEYKGEKQTILSRPRFNH